MRAKSVWLTGNLDSVLGLLACDRPMPVGMPSYEVVLDTR